MKSKSSVSLFLVFAVSLTLTLCGCDSDTGEQPSGSREDSAQQSDLAQQATSVVPEGGFELDATASEILGNADYPAFAFGGFRETTRDVVPTVDQLKEDLKILDAMGVKLLRTYNTQEFAHASNLLEAIRQLRIENAEFEMYVMLGAWISCEGAFGASPDHEGEDYAHNKAEIDAAVELANKYPESVKIIAVGNEAMVHWAAAYFVKPGVILAWVEHLQQLKASGDLSADVWITSSDNFASWGGGEAAYHNDDLNKLIRTVDFVSMHTYPFHDSHYNSDYWLVPEDEADFSPVDKAKAAVERAKDYAISQYESTAAYVRRIDPDKPVHIGETGWATSSNGFYGPDGSQAADEYKMKLYYDAMREWTSEAGMTCFYFEAFDEPWKDGSNPGGSENHFGMINIRSEAKYALWGLVDDGVFQGLTRGGKPITKSFGGDEAKLLENVLVVPDSGNE